MVFCVWNDILEKAKFVNLRKKKAIFLKFFWCLIILHFSLPIFICLLFVASLLHLFIYFVSLRKLLSIMSNKEINELFYSLQNQLAAHIT